MKERVCLFVCGNTERVESDGDTWCTSSDDRAARRRFIIIIIIIIIIILTWEWPAWPLSETAAVGWWSSGEIVRYIITRSRSIKLRLKRETRMRATIMGNDHLYCAAPRRARVVRKQNTHTHTRADLCPVLRYGSIFASKHLHLGLPLGVQGVRNSQRVRYILTWPDLAGTETKKNCDFKTGTFKRLET